MKISTLGIIIYSNDTETVWNAFRMGNFALAQNDIVNIFLLGKGVEALNRSDERFDVKGQMENFAGSGGQILSCGTCLKIRQTEASAICPVSTMADLYEIIGKSDKVLTF